MDCADLDAELHWLVAGNRGCARSGSFLKVVEPRDRLHGLVAPNDRGDQSFGIARTRIYQ